MCVFSFSHLCMVHPRTCVRACVRVELIYAVYIICVWLYFMYKIIYTHFRFYFIIYSALLLLLLARSLSLSLALSLTHTQRLCEFGRILYVVCAWMLWWSAVHCAPHNARTSPPLQQPAMPLDLLSAWHMNDSMLTCWITHCSVQIVDQWATILCEERERERERASARAPCVNRSRLWGAHHAMCVWVCVRMRPWARYHKESRHFWVILREDTSIEGMAKSTIPYSCLWLFYSVACAWLTHQPTAPAFNHSSLCMKTPNIYIHTRNVVMQCAVRHHRCYLSGHHSFHQGFCRIHKIHISRLLYDIMLLIACIESAEKSNSTSTGFVYLPFPVSLSMCVHCHYLTAMQFSIGCEATGQWHSQHHLSSFFFYLLRERAESDLHLLASSSVSSSLTLACSLFSHIYFFLSYFYHSYMSFCHIAKQYWW